MVNYDLIHNVEASIVNVTIIIINVIRDNLKKNPPSQIDILNKKIGIIFKRLDIIAKI